MRPRGPNLNAYAERWVQSIKHECLDHFVVFGKAHLRHLVTEYVDYYNQQRPHQANGNRPLSVGPPPEVGGEVACEEWLGGPLKHYQRAA